MVEPQLKYVMDFEKVQKIAMLGIGRASRFARFAAVSEATLETYNAYQHTDGEIQFHMCPPMKKEHFSGWETQYKDWIFSNAVNEIIEKFYTFLEFSIVVIELQNQKISFKKGDNLHELKKAIKIQENAIRREYQYYPKIKAYLREANIIFSSAEEEIADSFSAIRNLLTHNGGIADHRPALPIEDDKLLIKWYYPELFGLGAETGKEIPIIIGKTFEEAVNVSMRPKGLKTKRLILNEHITFTYREVQEIGWTFYLLVLSLSEQISKVIANRQPA